MRAVAVVAPSRWGGRPRRRVSYDAWWPDGRVEVGVVPGTVMQRRSPADAADLREAVHGWCPEVGAGPWCDEIGRVVDGPVAADVDADSPRRRRGERREFGVPSYDPATPRRRTGRLVVGLVALLLGVTLLVVTAGDGPLAALALVPLGVGVALLADFVPRDRRWW